MQIKSIRSAAVASYPKMPRLRNYYAKGGMVEKLLGRYTVEAGAQRYKVNLRLTDYEGNRPSLASTLALPAMVSTYLSTRRKPILKNPKPFLVYDAVRKLERILEPGMRVLELGGGNSTLWFLEQGCHVTTLEHSADWASYIESYAHSQNDDFRSRLNMHVTQGEAAMDLIRSFPDQSFDLVLVDSMNEFTSRHDGAREARSKVKRGGWIVLDNSDAPVNWPAVSFLGEEGRERFTGYAYMTPYVSQTSFWRKS